MGEGIDSKVRLTVEDEGLGRSLDTGTNNLQISVGICRRFEAVPEIALATALLINCLSGG